MRRILKDLLITHVACVDHPCQEHARVVIMKRALDQLDIRKAAINDRLEKLRVVLLGKRLTMLKTEVIKGDGIGVAAQLKRKGSQKLKPINRIGYASS